MATLRELISQVKRIEISPSGPLVEFTVATETRNVLAPMAEHISGLLIEVLLPQDS